MFFGSDELLHVISDTLNYDIQLDIDTGSKWIPYLVPQDHDSIYRTRNIRTQVSNTGNSEKRFILTELNTLTCIKHKAKFGVYI